MGDGDAVEEARRPAGQVMVVEDDPEHRRIVTRALAREGYEVRAFEGGAKALEALHADPEWACALITDLHMPDMSGLELLAAARESWPDLPVILFTAATELQVAVAAMRAGAYDYLTKPVDTVHTLAPAVQRAVEHARLVRRTRLLEAQLGAEDRSSGIVGESRAMREVLALVAAVAPTDATVLILGESGTGKELVARAIHARSKRAGKTFVDVNCGAITEGVLESELFGHARGAFSGAAVARRGLFEEASGGTLFLDEVGEMTPATQVRLLRVLQERQVRPVGSNQNRAVDVRVIAATNRDLAQRVEDGEFRQDLYYRLDVMTIPVPPLRQRPEDVPALVQHFLAKYSRRLGKHVASVEPEAMERLTAHRWPGNVRELENAVERAIVLARGDTFGIDLLPAVVRQVAARGVERDARFLQTLGDAKSAFERDYLEDLLARAEGKISRAARLAGLDPSNLRRLLKRYGLDPGQGDAD